MPDAFFTRDGDRYLPTGLGASPWTGNTIGGVALAGLATHLMEALPARVPMHMARITIDILGAPPMEPLSGAAGIVRDGKRVQLLNAELSADGRTWVRASALRLRTEATPGQESPLACPFPVDRSALMRSDMAQSIWVDCVSAVPGRGARWVQMLYPVVAGTVLSPLERASMLSDFGSGISPLFPMREWSFANLDITLYLTRPPRGDWLLLDATSRSTGNGIGLAEGRLGDREGMIGHCTQTIFLTRR